MPIQPSVVGYGRMNFQNADACCIYRCLDSCIGVISTGRTENDVYD